jgi:hypothetical protein
MSDGFRNANALLRTLALVGFVALGGWWTLTLREKLLASERTLEARTAELERAKFDLEARSAEVARLGSELEARQREIQRLEAVVAEQAERIEELELARRLLKVQHRVARLEIVAQGTVPATADAPERTRTTVRFTELDEHGEPLGPGQELVVLGKYVYVESLVIQFDDSFVEQGDSLRGTSLCLFRRLFGEDQKPSEGPTIDTAGQQPLAYGGDTSEHAVHQALWQRFWEYANDPELARTFGVRALQGEAPFIEARLGKSYRALLRASGGLVLEAE